jgi:hypothetical protein
MFSVQLRSKVEPVVSLRREFVKGILYVNVAGLTKVDADNRVAEAESAIRVMDSLEELAVLRVYDGTPTHFEQLYDRVPTALFG